MHSLSDAYRLRAALIAERSEERAAAKAVAEPVMAKKPHTSAAPVTPSAERRPVFSFGALLRLPALR